MVGVRGEGESGRGCRKFRGNGGRGVLLCSAAAQPGRELFVQGQRGLPVSVMILVTDCWAGAGSPRVAARAAIVAMFMVVQDGVRLGGKLNRLK